ncbi:MAG: hypothetical protein ABI841_06720, partial [Chloroflexota bacterium]
MFGFVAILFSQFKILVVAAALVGGATVAVVVDQVVTPGAQATQELGDDDRVAHGTDREELLAEFAEECGPDAVAPDLTGLTEDEAEALIEPLIEACEEA